MTVVNTELYDMLVSALRHGHIEGVAKAVRMWPLDRTAYLREIVRQFASPEDLREFGGRIHYKEAIEVGYGEVYIHPELWCLTQ